MRSVFLVAAAVALGVLFSGCVMPDDRIQADVFILSYTLRDLTDGSQPQEAYPGEHCGTARLHDSYVEVARSTWDAIGRPAQFVVVQPAVQGNWVTIGTEAFPLALPTEVNPHVQANPDEFIVTLEWRSDSAGNEGLWIDGQNIALPFAFTFNSFSQNWDAVSVLARGPGQVRLFDAGLCA